MKLHYVALDSSLFTPDVVELLGKLGVNMISVNHTLKRLGSNRRRSSALAVSDDVIMSLDNRLQNLEF